MQLNEKQKVKVLTLRNQETQQQDQYALTLKPIGQGKYARVYKATSMLDPNKVFAVKVIKITSEETRKEYLKQLKIIKNLPKCPNLVTTYKQHLESENNLYIFQQFCKDGTLVSYRAQKFAICMAENQIYDLFFQLSNGLITLLQAGIVHQDIKPVNILKKGKLFKLCDFGVSQIQKDYQQTTTRRGTVSYMPPQKLKSRKFVPNQKSDIFSLGVCLYQTIFGFQPYIKKKTSNYKQYLKTLQTAVLRPIPILMNKIGSTSQRLQTVLSFIEKMIDLNYRTRVSLEELKSFVRTTQPFVFMSIPEEEIPEVKEEARVSFGQNFYNLQESIINYRVQAIDSLQVAKINEAIVEQQAMVTAQKIQIGPTKEEIQALQAKAKLQLIRKRFGQQHKLIVNMMGWLLRGAQSIITSNFNDMNIQGANSKIFDFKMSQCKFSRYFRYLVYEFSLAVYKQLRGQYEQYLSEQAKELLKNDRNHVGNLFNKFLMESVFKEKEELAKLLQQLQSPLVLWQQLVSVVLGSLNTLTMIKQNKKDFMFSAIFCLSLPSLLQTYSKIQTIFGSKRVGQMTIQQFAEQMTIQRASKTLQGVWQYAGKRASDLRQDVESKCEDMKIDVVFQIQEDSQQAQVLGEDLDD